MFGRKKESDKPEAAPEQPSQRDNLVIDRPRAQSPLPAGPSRAAATPSTPSRPLPPSATATAEKQAEASLPDFEEVRRPSDPNKPVTPPVNGAANGSAAPNGAVGASALNGSAKPADAAGKRLSVGKGISLSGEIKNCEQLLVEGEIEATLSDCESLEIAQDGLFKGSAEVENATIAGTFDGDIKVKGCLTVKSGGEVKGSITYGDLAIERGGKLRGKLEELKG
ncbi:polymer-forming cytoskeletal protein [Limibacillus halophilus]|jgi:cytoskeletal protein CcmA (bactofilin family)